jgi:HAD superfamily hydrolase (TIGR01509 family)
MYLAGWHRKEGQAEMRGLIFDFDGVIADSEALANTVLAEVVSGLGCKTSLDDALTRYMGKRWPEVLQRIEEDVGAALPLDFAEHLKTSTLERFRTDLREVQGARAFIKKFDQLPRCIASSSSLDRLHLCLEVLGLAAEFGDRVYSADMVERGKPHPDIFLLAATSIGVAADQCIVIQDSASGVQAAKAAGMTAIGLHAASHLRAGHDGILNQAGAIYTAATWDDVTRIVSGLV